MLTKVDLALISPGTNSISGDILKVNEGLISPQADQTAGEAIYPVKGSYDASSGVAFIHLSNQDVVRIQGLPTTQTIGEGPRGRDGLRGKPGQDGKNGKDGKDGLRGCAGPKGDRGRRGPIGPIGPTGATGATGNIGPTGATGSTGPKGLDGQEPIYVAGSLGSYEYTVRYGRITQWGTYKAGSTDQSIDIPFPIAFNRECTTVQITFHDAKSDQAREYEPQWDTEGFILEMPVGTPIPLDEPWEFSWSAYGD